jgi:hypothetical protein
MNVSVYVEDVSDWECRIFQSIDGHLQFLNWNNLDDTFVGSSSGEGAFQVGSISDMMYFVFDVERIQAGEGRLDIEITEFLTNNFEFMPPVQYQGAAAAGVDTTTLTLVAGGGIAIVAVVIVIVILKRRS